MCNANFVRIRRSQTPSWRYRNDVTIDVHLKVVVLGRHDPSFMLINLKPILELTFVSLLMEVDLIIAELFSPAGVAHFKPRIYLIQSLWLRVFNSSEIIASAMHVGVLLVGCYSAFI